MENTVYNFIENCEGSLNSEVINFVDYKKDYFESDVFKSKFSRYFKEDKLVDILIKNFMKHYECWSYYTIKDLFIILQEKNLIKG